MATANDATWNYISQALTSTGTVSLTGRCVGVRVINTHASNDAYFKAQSGDDILVKAGREIYLNPQRKMVNPVITWVSGSMDVFIEVVR